MSVLAQLYFKIVEVINYMFRPFSVWTIQKRARKRYKRTKNILDLHQNFSASYYHHQGIVVTSEATQAISILCVIIIIIIV
jgi:hypothetical protein